MWYYAETDHPGWYTSLSCGRKKLSLRQVRWEIRRLRRKQSRLSLRDVPFWHLLLRSRGSLPSASKSRIRRGGTQVRGRSLSIRMMTSNQNFVRERIIGKYTGILKRKHVFGLSIRGWLNNSSTCFDRYLKRHFDAGILKNSIGSNVLEECKKIKGMSRIAAHVSHSQHLDSGILSKSLGGGWHTLGFPMCLSKSAMHCE